MKKPDPTTQRHLLKLERRIFHLEQKNAKTVTRYKKQMAKMEANYAALKTEYSEFLESDRLTPGLMRAMEEDTKRRLRDPAA